MSANLESPVIRLRLISFCLINFFLLSALTAQAAVSFLGVAAGDAGSTSIILWTRAADNDAPANTPLMVEYSTSPLPAEKLDQVSALLRGITQLPGACVTDST